MKNSIKYIILLITACMAVCSCEKDDICPQNTAKTPTAHVFFFITNNGRPLETTIGDIKFYGLRDNIVLEEISPEADRKSIQLPIDFEAESSRYLLANGTKTDTLTLKYNPKLTFISKACGYRFTFENTTVDCSKNQLIEDISKEIEAEPYKGYLFNSKQTCAILYLTPQP